MLKLIQGGRTEITKADMFNPRLAHLQQNEHMKEYYKATRTFEAYWEKLTGGEGR